MDYQPKPMNWIEWLAVAVCITGLVMFTWFFIQPPSHAQATNAQANQIEINAQVAYGLGYQSNTVLMNYCEPGTTTALFNMSNTVVIPPATTDYAVNLSTMFPSINSAVCWGVEDISNPGQAFSLKMDPGGNSFSVAPSGFVLTRVNGSAPTLYLDNTSTTNYAIIKVFCIAN